MLNLPYALLLASITTVPAWAVERINFTSYNPQDYAAILDGSYRQRSASLQGYLSKPAQGQGKLPAVIIIPDSGGFAPWLQTTLAEVLNEAGIATFVIDSFAGRGIGEVATDQARVPMAASVMDGFSALQALAARPDIDSARIGITGLSRGGVVSMFTAERRLVDKVLAEGPRFAAHLPFYPGCSTQWMNPTPTAAPMRFLLGEKDTYTPAANCIRYAERLKSLGAPVDYVVYPGATHAWMSDFDVRNSPYAQTFGECDLQIQDDGEVRDMKSGATTREGWREFVGKVVRSCGGRGATVGAHPSSRKAAQADMLEFFKQHLLRP